MKHGLAASAILLALGGCSGSSGGAYNDVATGTRLVRERPLSNATIGPAGEACGLGEILTDLELTG